MTNINDHQHSRKEEEIHIGIAADTNVGHNKNLRNILCSYECKDTKRENKCHMMWTLVTTTNLKGGGAKKFHANANANIENGIWRKNRD